MSYLSCPKDSYNEAQHKTYKTYRHIDTPNWEEPLLLNGLTTAKTTSLLACLRTRFRIVGVHSTIPKASIREPITDDSLKIQLGYLTTFPSWKYLRSSAILGVLDCGRGTYNRLRGLLLLKLKLAVC